MLSSLQIENVAVIQKANVHFEKGLNVLTGETGAGKSILIDSINAIEPPHEIKMPCRPSELSICYNMITKFLNLCYKRSYAVVFNCCKLCLVNLSALIISSCLL